MLRLLAYVLPLGLDSFAVAAALGALRPTRRQRWRTVAILAGFEAGMPLVGVAVGAPIARAVAGIADWLAAAALIAVGAWMLLSGGDDERDLAARLNATHGRAVLGLGLGISLDELAIGFSLGLARLPLVPVLIAVAVQALLAAQLGLWIGVSVGERVREGIERLAAIALIILGLVLAAAQL